MLSRMARTWLILLGAVVLGACGPKTSSTGIPVYPPKTDLAGAGHRCSSGGLCACRPLLGGDQDELQPPSPGTKRYEIRIPVTVHQVWVHVGGRGTFYKPAERGDETCVYVDLPPGELEVTYKIHEQASGVGFPAIFRIFEYGTKTHGWYEAFSVDCGTAEGVCTKGGLEDWITQTHKGGGLIDSCSSTRYKNVRWNADEWEGGRLRDLAITVTLKVYKFEPTRAPRSRCKGKGGGAEPGPSGGPEEAPAGAPPGAPTGPSPG